MVRLLDMGYLLVNLKLPSMVNNHLKLPSMVNNHPRFLPLFNNNKANLALVSSRNRLSRVGKGVKSADNSD